MVENPSQHTATLHFRIRVDEVLQGRGTFLTLAEARRAAAELPPTDATIPSTDEGPLASLAWSPTILLGLLTAAILAIRRPPVCLPSEAPHPPVTRHPRPCTSQGEAIDDRPEPPAGGDARWADRGARRAR